MDSKRIVELHKEEIHEVKKQTIYAVVAWLALTLVACSPLQVTSQREVKDSVRVEERIVKVPFMVPAETLRVEVPVPAPCDSVIGQMFIVKESNRAKVSISKKQKVKPDEPTQLIIEANCKALNDSLAVKEKEITRLRTDVGNSVTIKNACAQCVKWYHTAALWACGIFTLWYGGRFAWNYFKRFLKPI
ncbi:MAG: hypothetical protein AB7P01_06105 [Bacteroidia bacterium]